ncbi:MAG TPA: hypothetical protein VKV02_00065 [Acidobacteriaceae bacterium]|nr:hypothetical protein [Acidobacteriaceae bacterium]
MIDKEEGQEARPEATASRSPDTPTPAGFCQECGRSLTSVTFRRVGNGIFCEPCAGLQHGTAGWRPVPAAGYPSAPGAGTLPPGSGEPNPLLAGILGLIPGVGAMFNGQYAKGAMHLIVFVVLVSLADNLNWVLWWLVWGWIFYQGFDAYHTAKARRDNLPLPNPFGWNDLGERFGYMRHPAAAPPAPHFGTREDPQGTRTGTAWAGYVQAPELISTPIPVPVDAPSQNPYTAPFAATEPVRSHVPPPGIQVPYVPTYTGVNPGVLPVRPPVTGSVRRFPLGAFWLIGLGTLFLFGNLSPELRLSGRWMLPLLLAAASLWTAVRRVDLLRTTTGIGSLQSLAGAMVGPVLLFTVAALLALQAGHVVLMRRSWPALLVVWGAMLLVQRTGSPIATEASLDHVTNVPPAVRSTSGTGSLGL